MQWGIVGMFLKNPRKTLGGEFNIQYNFRLLDEKNNKGGGAK